MLLGISVCPLEILSRSHSALESWIYEIHQRTLQLLMEFIQWQNIWRRVRFRYLFTWQYFLRDYYLWPSTEGFVSRQSQDSLLGSWKLCFLPHPFWSGGGNSFSAHTLKNSLCKSNLLELSCHLFPGESLTASLMFCTFQESVNLQIYQPCMRVFFPTQPYQCLTLTSFSPTWWIQ